MTGWIQKSPPYTRWTQIIGDSIYIVVGIFSCIIGYSFENPIILGTIGTLMLCAAFANCIVNFKYGQKSMGFFKSWLLSFDDNVEWYANGLAGNIPEELYNSIVSEIKKR